MFSITAIAGMLGLTRGKAIIVGVLVAAVVAIIGLGYLHYTSLLKDNRILRENAVKLEQAVETQKEAIRAQGEAIDEWDRQVDRIVRGMEEMAEAQERASAYVRRLNDTLAKHDLGGLAAKKPGLVEPRLNAGTRDVLRMLECRSAGRTDCTSRSEEAREGPAGP